MKTLDQNKSRENGAAMVFYLLLMFVTVAVIGGVMTYVSGTVNLQHRRSDMVAAQEYAQAGAVLACDEMNKAYTSNTTRFPDSLLAKGYSLDSSLSTAQTNVYKRTVSSPFVGQTVQVQVWVPSSASPTTAKIVGIATRGKVTQSATANLTMTWGYPAAIISTNSGTNDTGISSSVAKKGNVAIDGDKSGPIIVDGGNGMAVLANGSVNIDPVYATVPKDAVSAKTFGSADEIPDYTAQGTDNSLFDFKRFTAAADATPNLLSESGTNHFTSLESFLKANALAAASPAKALEGIIVVDIQNKSDPGINILANPDDYVGTVYMPAVSPSKNGITVKGTLFFKFGPAFGPLDKIFNRMPMNINPANLSGLNPKDPSTYPSGYPAAYSNPAKDPVNINIANKGFDNFTPGEDLPAVLYSIGTVDMHGPVNISGVVYTPSYSEIENRPNEGFKVANQIQYIRGSVIVGLGIYFENRQAASSMISLDMRTLDSLATMGNSGKSVMVSYWE